MQCVVPNVLRDIKYIKNSVGLIEEFEYGLYYKIIIVFKVIFPDWDNFVLVV